LLKVMLVDDVEIVRIEMKRMPVWGEKSGFEVVCEAKNGEEALEKLGKQEVDMVITDIRMPKLDGMELLNEIVANGLCSCVVLLSDISEFSYARRGMILGAFDYIPKPADEEELLKLLKRAYEHIIDEKKENERVKKLEEVFEEKIGDFFQGVDIKEIAALIQSRDEKAIDKIRHTVKRIGANLDYNLLKAEGAMKKAIPLVISSLLLENPWLEKYINTSVLNNLTTRQFSGFDELLDYIMRDVTYIFNIFQVLQLGYQEKGIVWEVCNHVLQNIDEGLSLQTVAERLYMNRTYISEVFKQKTGISFTEYLTRVKMERAKKLLEAEEVKVYEVAEVLGYKDSEYFGKIFKKYAGKSVTEYKQVNRQ